MLDRDHCRENGSKGRNKRRFSEDQIKSLETIFDAENKLEPRRKMELARELGLQPRQIAIWFQNRRARYKSKLLQREYSVLKASYDSLASSFESLKQEKQTLLKQLQKLGDVIEKPDGSETMGEKRWDGLGSDNDGDSEFKEKVGMKLKVGSDSREVFYYSDGEDSKNTGGCCEEPELLSMAEPKVSDSLTFPPEKLCDLDSRCYFEQSSLQWWELWP